MEKDVDFFSTWLSPAPFSNIAIDTFEVGERSLSEAWLHSISCYSARLALFLDQDIVDTFPKRSRFASGLVPTGRADYVGNDTWRVHGLWRNLSGIIDASFAVLKAACNDGEMRFFIVDSTSWELIYSWDVIGLRETRSEAIFVRGVDVRSPYVVDASLIESGLRNASITAVKPPFRAVGGLTVLSPLTVLPAHVDGLIQDDARSSRDMFSSALQEANSLSRDVALMLDSWEDSIDSDALRGKVACSAQKLRSAASKYLLDRGTSAWRRNDAIGSALIDIIVGLSHPAVSLNSLK